MMGTGGVETMVCMARRFLKRGEGRLRCPKIRDNRLKHPAALEESPKGLTVDECPRVQKLHSGRASDGAGCVGPAFLWADESTTPHEWTDGRALQRPESYAAVLADGEPVHMQTTLS